MPDAPTYKKSIFACPMKGVSSAQPRYAYKDQKEQIYPARIRRVEQWDNGCA